MTNLTQKGHVFNRTGIIMIIKNNVFIRTIDTICISKQSSWTMMGSLFLYIGHTFSNVSLLYVYVKFPRYYKKSIYSMHRNNHEWDSHKWNWKTRMQRGLKILSFKHQENITQFAEMCLCHTFLLSLNASVVSPSKRWTECIWSKDSLQQQEPFVKFTFQAFLCTAFCKTTVQYILHSKKDRNGLVF